eukprot:gnl/TRDRNA2_/TRDRNA2_93467_c0_seq1.p1 gnl/TRDRNA2_/TRDRNA2_93467_c0~~gnl/TRDRNA2_/TRDRNA2_93467_c0_seq1.p1  ORF type:complete len:206 (-),score=21.33 gnl/TRDRNA2_/TRDRNA2_93467_c0_seq1:28-645(-)
MQASGLLPRPSGPRWEHLGLPDEAWDSKEARLKILEQLEPHFLAIAEDWGQSLANHSGEAVKRGLHRLLGVDWSLSELFGHIDTSLMWMNSPEADARAVGITSFVSLLNHSCIPNARIYAQSKCAPSSKAAIADQGRFDGLPLNAGMWVCCEALRDIRSGEELSISYVSLTEILETRQRLLRQFTFECNCHKCRLESIVLRWLHS